MARHCQLGQDLDLEELADLAHPAPGEMMSRTNNYLSCLVGCAANAVSTTTDNNNCHRRRIRKRRYVSEKVLLLHIAVAVVLLLATSCDCHASLPLDCKAMGSLEDPGNTSKVVVQQQQQQQEDEYYYAIGTVDPNNAQGATATAEPMPFTDAASLLKTQPPSMAPSMAQPCSDQFSNARGQYTSTMAPCVVKFHNANIQREGQEEDQESSQTGQQQQQQVQRELDFIDYRTSNLCHDDNVIIEIKEYVQAWPDECVGDFERCYSLEHHFSLLCDFLCEKEQQESSSDYAVGLFSPYQQQQQRPQQQQQYHPHWALPEGTTHVSVTCTLDKELVMEENDKEARVEREELREAQRRDMQSRLFDGLVVFVSALTIIYALSQLIVTPLVTVATAVVVASRRGRGRGATGGGDIDDDDIDDGSHLSVRRSSSSRNRRRTSFLDRRGSSISSLPVHQQEVAALVVSSDELTLDGDELDLRYEDERRASGSDTVSSLHDTSASFHHPQAGEDEDEHYFSSAAAQDHESSDFDSQIPLDFDAVPIVPAMILQDGIIYS